MEENMRDGKFITGETDDELLEKYFKEKGINIETEMDEKDFCEWLDKRAIECLMKEFPNTSEKRIREIKTILEMKMNKHPHKH